MGAHTTAIASCLRRKSFTFVSTVIHWKTFTAPWLHGTTLCSYANYFTRIRSPLSINLLKLCKFSTPNDLQYNGMNDSAINSNQWVSNYCNLLAIAHELYFMVSFLHQSFSNKTRNTVVRSCLKPKFIQQRWNLAFFKNPSLAHSPLSTYTHSPL